MTRSRDDDDATVERWWSRLQGPDATTRRSVRTVVESSNVGWPVAAANSETQNERRQDMDHGVLNVPLAKRGDIDREVREHKAELAAKAKAKATERSEARKEAQRLLLEHGPELAQRLAAKSGKSAKAAESVLRAMAHHEPLRARSLLLSWVAERTAAPSWISPPAARCRRPHWWPPRCGTRNGCARDRLQRPPRAS